MQPFDGVGHEHANGGKTQDRKGILAPVHFMLGTDAGEPIDETLNGAEDRIEPGALPFEDAGQIDAHGTNGRQQNQGVESELQPAVGGHLRTSPDKAG